LARGLPHPIEESAFVLAATGRFAIAPTPRTPTQANPGLEWGTRSWAVHEKDKPSRVGHPAQGDSQEEGRCLTRLKLVAERFGAPHFLYPAHPPRRRKSNRTRSPIATMIISFAEPVEI
jgi:hypothetical protein